MTDPEQPSVLTLKGTDNYGKPRQEFASKIAAATEGEFIEIAKDHIWLSAYEHNNPHSDFHWKADACYDEAQRRGRPELYAQAYRKAAKE